MLGDGGNALQYPIAVLWPLSVSDLKARSQRNAELSRLFRWLPVGAPFGRCFDIMAASSSYLD